MCIGGGGPKMPSYEPPKMPEMPPLPEPPKPQPLPEPPAPAPVNVTQGEQDVARIKKRKTKREKLQQASSGANALRIPLNSGSDGGSGGGLNIPT